MDICVICKCSLETARDTDISILQEKGVQGILSASHERGDELHVCAGQKVHQHCRKQYCNKKTIASDKKLAATGRVKRSCTRSQAGNFIFSEHCFLCEQPVNLKNGHHI